MKKIAVMLLGVAGCMFAEAQQKPYYTQYILNNYILNPALSGIENYTDVKISYRNQWTGITGAPVTTYVSIQGPLNKKDYKTTATSFSVPGENPRGKQYWEEYTASAPHSGIGGIIMNDKTGYLNRWSASLSYAYHKPLGIKTTLSAGFQAGVSSVSLDRTKIVWGSLDPNDPAIGYSNGELKKIKPEIGAGLWLYSKDYFIGASVLNIIPSKAKFVNNDKYGTYFEPHFFGVAGYRFFLNDDISALPSVGLQWINPEPLQVHGNVKLQYRDQFWMGASYRFTDVMGGFAGMAGVNISNTFNISYAYDVATNSRLRSYTKNTHEIMIGFLLGNKYSDACPRCNW